MPVVPFLLFLLVPLAGLVACRPDGAGPPGPAAEGGEAGEPTLAASAPPRPPSPPLPPRPGAIQPDILMINDSVLTVAEVLYPLREELARSAKAAATQSAFTEQAQGLVRAQAQQDVGSILVFRQARAALGETRQKVVDDAVARVLNERAAREFGGSHARLDEHLSSHQLSRAQYRARIERDLLVRQYGRERFLPQLHLTRAELLEEYERHRERYTSQELRELFLIEAPFAAFLPPGTRWDAATQPARDQARRLAEARIRTAHTALGQRPFEEVAREYSHGPHAATGGAWGEIGKPLQPPLEEVSRRIFAMQPGQYTEPIETERGWYIARCGQVQYARTRPFLEVQDELREALRDQRFGRVTLEHVLKLAEGATISNLEAFIAEATRRATQRYYATGRAVARTADW